LGPELGYLERDDSCSVLSSASARRPLSGLISEAQDGGLHSGREALEELVEAENVGTDERF